MTEPEHREETMTEPVYMAIRAEIIDAPKDIQAIAAIDQIIRALQLTPQQAEAVLEFMHERAELPF